MRILYTADIHVHPDHLHHAVQAALDHQVDALIVGGDVVPHYLPGPAGMDALKAQAVYLKTVLLPALKRLRRKRPVEVFIDLGNDDFAVNRPILERSAPDSVRLLHMRLQRLTRGVDLVGYMKVPPTPFRRKDWEKPDTRLLPYPPGHGIRLDGYVTHTGHKQPITLDMDTSDTIASDLERLSAQIQRPFILVAHCPPYGTPLDQLADGTHAGSPSIRAFIESWSASGRLKAALHGHIHESPMVSGTNHCRINQALCINPGQGHPLHYVIMEVDASTGNVRLGGAAP